MLRPAPPFVLVFLLAQGCTGPNLAACGHVLWVPARAIDEGWRFEVKELRGDPIPIEDLRYRFTNRTAFGEVVEVLEGNLGELKASGGNHTLRFLDDKNNSFLNVDDAWVVRLDLETVLQLSRQGSILGTSQGCVR